MYLINNQPFINLDRFLDISSFQNLIPHINLAIAKNAESIEVGTSSQMNLLDQNLKAFRDVKAHYWGHPDKYPPNLNSSQMDTYLKLNKYVTLTETLAVRGTRNYNRDISNFLKKHLVEGSVDTPSAKDFRFLTDWINDQNCFEEYGRIIFFISEAGATGIAHKDHSSQVKDMFIWLTNPAAPKIIKLVDKITGIRHKSESNSAVFDNREYHETINPTPWTSWSLRIDGVFKREWALKAGIYKHFAEEIEEYYKDVK
jgi:hypothetical protein